MPPATAATLVVSPGLVMVTVVYFTPREGEDSVIAKIPGIADVSRGTYLRLTAAADKLHLFDGDGHSFFYK